MVVLAGLLAFAPAGALPLGEEDDAGSGRDAGNDAATGIAIEPGQAYSGSVTGETADPIDVYTFTAQAGDAIEARVSMIAGGCLHLYSPSGAMIDYDCSAGTVDVDPVRITASESGTWLARVGSKYPAQYSFSVDVDGDAPTVGPTPGDWLDALL